MAGGVEKASASVEMTPSFKDNAFRVVTNEEKLGKFDIRDIRDICRPCDMGLSRAMKFQFGAFFFAIGAINKQHGAFLMRYGSGSCLINQATGSETFQRITRIDFVGLIIRNRMGENMT